MRRFFILLVLAAPWAAAAGMDDRGPGLVHASAGRMVSSWQRAPQPRTVWQLAVTPVAVLQGRAAQEKAGHRALSSSFGPVATPASELVPADVAPERMEVVRTLLTELSARPAPAADPAAGGEPDILLDLPGDVLFNFDSDELRADAMSVMARVVDLLREFPRRSVTIAGHTDSRGDDAYNDNLSERRARSVYAHLRTHDDGVARRYDVWGFGRKRPVAANQNPDGSDNPDGRQQNRRVEIALVRAAP